MSREYERDERGRFAGDGGSQEFSSRGGGHASQGPMILHRKDNSPRGGALRRELRQFGQAMRGVSAKIKAENKPTKMRRLGRSVGRGLRRVSQDAKDFYNAIGQIGADLI